VRPLISGRLAGLEAAARVVDAWAFEGDAVVVAAAAAVLARLEARLYGAAAEVRAVLAGGESGVWDLGPTEEFVALVRAMVDGVGDAE